jgi:hypothetical protein
MYCVVVVMMIASQGMRLVLSRIWIKREVQNN